MKIGRRALTAGLLAAALPRRAFGDGGGEASTKLLDVRVPGRHSRRFTLLVPQHLAPGERVPLLVLLHGLGETVEERMGAYAWVERYGLAAAYERLRRPPVARTGTRADFADARVADINAELALRPFRGLLIACPYMPDLPIGAPGVLDDFARWITDTVAPRARAECPTLEDPAHTYLGGCSLGGHFSLEVFTRRAESFGAWGGVQTAISTAAAPRWAERLAQAAGGKRHLLVETSSGDPFRGANEALSSALTKRGAAHRFVAPPGPHDQIWLRESGTLEMLLWFDGLPRAQPRITRPPRRGVPG